MKNFFKIIIFAIPLLSGCFTVKDPPATGFGNQTYVWDDWEVSTNKYDWTFYP